MIQTGNWLAGYYLPSGLANWQPVTVAFWLKFYDFITGNVMVRDIIVKSLILCSLMLTLYTPVAEADSSEIGRKYAEDLSETFEWVANQITPAVVNISTRVKVRRGIQPPDLPSDPFFEYFRDFFGEDFFDRYRRRPAPRGLQPYSMGTGVIVDRQGHILTNNHVVGEADEVKVTLYDKRTVKAKIIGTDPRTDLAVIKIEAKNLKPAVLGDSDKLKIGEWVIAAGNPFGLSNTITAGIVSAKGRSLMGGGRYEDYIQTDAAINPGNSGGPLVNLHGEVVGINTAIYSKSGGYMGIGFAIPVNMAKSVMQSLIKEGRVVRGWLGVIIQDLDENLAKSFNYPSTEGALVGDVQKNGPAQKAGLKQGDIIIRFNGRKIKSVNQLRNEVAAVRPGTRVSVDVIRNGRKKTLKVKIGELPSEDKMPGLGQRESQTEENELGISVDDLTEDMADRLGTDAKEGVVVTRVLPGSIAAQAGIRPRDIILKVNGKKVSDADQFRAALKKANLKKGIRMIIESRGIQRFVFMRAEE
ncbi:MAG: DegQ family serine endoprotease [Candidatus Dadabacteria bacterium]|nr:MAG: DegQ family serine endoprotease [Candidatus Dadabacteria bacterium]